jgi:hypothetical protein
VPVIIDRDADLKDAVGRSSRRVLRQRHHLLARQFVLT